MKMPEDLSSTCSKTVPLDGNFCVCIEILPVNFGEPFRSIKKISSSMRYGLEEGYERYSCYVNRTDKINLLKCIFQGQRFLRILSSKEDYFLLEQIVLIAFKGPKEQ